MSHRRRTLSRVDEHWPDRWDRGRQHILNAHPVPDRFHDARHHPIPVTARIEWERDGVELRATEATGWTRHLVLVTITDPRARSLGYWIGVEDVERR